MALADPESDEELLNQAAAGHKPSFEKLFARHQGRVGSVLRRLTRNASDAEELTQETFLRVLRGSELFRGGKFTSWLYRIALNLARDLGRRRKAVTLEREEATPSGRAGPSEQAAQAEEAEMVRRALERLPGPQKTAIILSRYEGLSYEEIAEIEECSVDAVKQRVRRGLMALSEDLKGLA
ncbi:MAG TPA: sigma-70 family RNA polymerase sigma factor [Candidatus Brocadiia bacterium]|nr:sigma-70 family RNA polymerase sigma factor [Candidatus Brocadiia bacterium]